MLMVDKRPAIRADCYRRNAETGQSEMQSAPKLAVFDCLGLPQKLERKLLENFAELRKKLSLYGFEIGVFDPSNNFANSVLLDVWGRSEGKADGDYVSQKKKQQQKINTKSMIYCIITFRSTGSNQAHIFR